MNRPVPEDDDDFPIIANNAEAPCNQPFKLRKPAMQGNVSGALKVQASEIPPCIDMDRVLHGACAVE